MLTNPSTSIPALTSSRPLVDNDPPTPTLPDTFNVPVIPVFAKDETPETFNELSDAAELTVNDPPTATLPEVVKVERVIAPKVVVPAFNVPKLVNPVTFNPLNDPKPVIDPPTPRLPVVVKEVAVIAPVESEVEVIAPAFNVPKLVNPVTFNPLNAPKPVILPPTPTLPVVVKEVALMFVALMVVEVNAPVLTTPS